jgi:hypothetical protein
VKRRIIVAMAAAVLSLGVCCSGRLRRSGLRSGQQLQGPTTGGEVSSSGPDDNGARLQVGAAALKHCVALGCIPEATLLLEHDQGAGNACRRGPARSQGADTITVDLADPAVPLASLF